MNLYPPLSISSYVRLNTRVISIVRGGGKKEKRETGAVNVSSAEHYAEEAAAAAGRTGREDEGRAAAPFVRRVFEDQQESVQLFRPAPAAGPTDISRRSFFFISPVVK